VNNANHNKLIRDAARRHLDALGMQQRGRSRTWIDDRGWCLITVEFQPSSWSRGTYLNVGATWLWSYKDHLSFDLGSRVEGFQELTGPDAHAACERIASRAADEVEALRKRIPDVNAVAGELKDVAIERLRPSFDAAVALGLIGRVVDARHRFAVLGVTDGTEPEPEWVTELRGRASMLLVLVGDRDGFLEEIKRTIRQTRRALRLSDWDGELPADRQ
jgi:hypothetical protein